MAIDPTSGITANATRELGLDQLLRVLLAQLTHQDPFKPMENKDFMAQIAQFASLETTQQLNQNILQLLTVQALGQTVGLVGKDVTALTDTGTVRGRVTAVTMTADGAPRLTLDVGGGNVVPGVAIGQIQVIQP